MRKRAPTHDPEGQSVILYILLGAILVALVICIILLAKIARQKSNTNSAPTTLTLDANLKREIQQLIETFGTSAANNYIGKVRHELKYTPELAMQTRDNCKAEQLAITAVGAAIIRKDLEATQKAISTIRTRMASPAASFAQADTQKLIRLEGARSDLERQLRDAQHRIDMLAEPQPVQ